MERFVNHVLYGIHLFTRNLEPVVYHGNKLSHNALLARKVMGVIIMNYLVVISYAFMFLIFGRAYTLQLLDDETYFLIFWGVLIVIGMSLHHYWFDKDDKEEMYYNEFVLLPDSRHFEWRLIAIAVFMFPILIVCLYLNYMN